MIGIAAVGMLAMAIVQAGAGVGDVGGAPMLKVDGKPIAPLMFMGWWGTDAKTVEVGPEWRKVVVEFVSPEDAEGAPGFQVRVGGPPAGKVWIDDLRYYEGTPDKPAGPNMQPHGDFEDTGDNLPANWAVYCYQDQGAKAATAIDDTVAAHGKRSLRIDVQNPGTAPIHVHLYLYGCKVQRGHHYTVELQVRAEPKKTVDVMPLHQAPPWTLYPILGQANVFMDQVRLAAQAGVHLQYPAVGMPWPKPGEEADYTQIDASFTDIVMNDPQAKIVIRYGMEPPDWWTAEHPLSVNYCHDGKPAQVWVGYEEWVKEACRWQEAMVRHIEKTWGDRVVAYHPCGQHTGEWFYVGGWESRVPCFGKGVDATFRQWAQDRYKTPEAASAAWARKVGAWDEVAAPTVEERRKGDLGQLLDPRSQKMTIDFFDFLQQKMAEAISAIAKSVKTAAPDKAVILFYGYLYELAPWGGGIGTSGHYGWRWMKDDPNVDIFCSPISYGDRQFGGVGRFMAPVESVAAHGKQWFNEDDTRTFMAPDDGFGRVDTLEHSQWVHARNFSHIFPRRMGCWYMDLGGTGWMKDRGLWDNVARLRKVYEQHLGEPRRFKPEIAVIIDERSALHTPVGSALPSPLLSELRSPIMRIGAPVGWWLMDDLLAGKVPPAKMYIMQDAWVLDAAQRRKLLEILRKQKATAVWFYAPGYLDPEKGPAGPEAMAELTGMRLAEMATPAPDKMTPVVGSGWAGGVPGPFGTGVEGLRPQIAAEAGAGVEAIASYASGETAVAAAKGAGYQAVFVGGLTAPPELLRNIAERAGVHVYCDSNDMIDGDGQFLAIAATSEGDKVLRLPRASKVTDALGGGVLGQGHEVRFHLQLGEVRLMWVQAAGR
jgi:hypothetical protein